MKKTRYAVKATHISGRAISVKRGFRSLSAAYEHRKWWLDRYTKYGHVRIEFCYIAPDKS